jgi:broad specificity phosphatase PhoE
MSLEIYIARHGQNQDNANGILNGHRDLSLTELGKRQAQELAQAISEASLKFDAVYSSPLLRALETARVISSVTGAPKPIVYGRLIERDFGILTGKAADRIEELCKPNIIKTDTITYFLSASGAETFPQLVKRGQEILDFVRNNHKSGKVLLVCHGDIGKMIYCAATGKAWEDVLIDFHFGNGDLIDVSGIGEAHKVKLVQHNH